MANNGGERVNWALLYHVCKDEIGLYYHVRIRKYHKESKRRRKRNNLVINVFWP